MGFRHKLEFRSLQARLGLSAVAVFLMLTALKMKKKSYFIFLGFVPSSPNFLRQSEWPGGPKPMWSAVLFLNDLKWPSISSYGLQCRRSAENVNTLKLKKKKIIQFLFLNKLFLVCNQQKIWRISSSHSPPINL
jgi:hypothetical protein